jgi:protein-S-isoprenylcysteine O-methyltransferase Ste14
MPESSAQGSLTEDIIMKNSASLAESPSQLLGLDLGKLQQSRAYDVLMRLPMLAWSVFFAIKAVARLTQYEREADPMLPDALFAVNIAMQLAVIAFCITLAGTVVLRARPTGRARGFEPRVSALIGTFLISVVILFPSRELSFTMGVFSTLLVLTGNTIAVYALTHLGRSFSIMPEARGLVTRGMYRYVRHPLYLAEVIASIGTVLQFLSGWTALILAVQITFQLRRMQNEEAVLMEVFPEYAAYKEKTARLIPGIY